jgi:hypothetical protein
MTSVRRIAIAVVVVITAGCAATAHACDPLDSGDAYSGSATGFGCGLTLTADWTVSSWTPGTFSYDLALTGFGSFAFFEIPLLAGVTISVDSLPAGWTSQFLAPADVSWPFATDDPAQLPFENPAAFVQFTDTSNGADLGTTPIIIRFESAAPPVLAPYGIWEQDEVPPTFFLDPPVPVPAPEPASLAVFGAGLGGLCAVRFATRGRRQLRFTTRGRRQSIGRGDTACG